MIISSRTPKPYQILSYLERKRSWARRAFKAEWENVPEGQLGGIILQQRQRANVSNTRAMWVMTSLIITVLSGIFFYIIAPVLEKRAVASIEIYQTKVDLARKATARLDADLGNIMELISSKLRYTGIAAKLDNNGERTLLNTTDPTIFDRIRYSSAKPQSDNAHNNEGGNLIDIGSIITCKWVNAANQDEDVHIISTQNTSTSKFLRYNSEQGWTPLHRPPLDASQRKMEGYDWRLLTQGGWLLSFSTPAYENSATANTQSINVPPMLSHDCGHSWKKLEREDGKTFRIMDGGVGISTNRQHAIIVDDDGYAWISSQNEKILKLSSIYSNTRKKNIYTYTSVMYVSGDGTIIIINLYANNSPETDVGSSPTLSMISRDGGRKFSQLHLQDGFSIDEIHLGSNEEIVAVLSRSRTEQSTEPSPKVAKKNENSDRADGEDIIIASLDRKFDRIEKVIFEVKENNIRDFRDISEGFIYSSYCSNCSLSRKTSKDRERELNEIAIININKSEIYFSSEVREILVDKPIMINGNNYIIGLSNEGRLMRSDNFGRSWESLDHPFEASDVFGATSLDGRLLIFGRDGLLSMQIEKKDDDVNSHAGNAPPFPMEHKMEWVELPTAVRTNFYYAHWVQDGKALILRDSTNGIVKIDTGLHSAIKLFKQANQEAGRAAFTAMEAKSIVEYLSTNFPRGLDVTLREKELESNSTRRSMVEAERRDAQESLNAFRDGTLTETQRLDLFRKFMEECKATSKEDKDVLKSCLDAWKNYMPSEEDTIFETLAEKVPPGILLLFLLSTLDGLFRYNLRLSEFHHSRADALGLISEKGDPKELEALGKLVDALAGDKVEFGKGNSPSEQAISLAKTILTRKPDA